MQVKSSAGTQRGVLNIGFRPTLARPEPTMQVEAHVLDFDGDLYDQWVELIFVSKLREEQKFPSIDALREQITRDIAVARKLFS